MSRLTWRVRLGGGVAAALCGLLVSSVSAEPAIDVDPAYRAEVAVAGVPRPVQVALDAAGRLVILSHGWRGDAAAEIYRLDPGALPMDNVPEPMSYSAHCMPPGSPWSMVVFNPSTPS